MKTTTVPPFGCWLRSSRAGTVASGVILALALCSGACGEKSPVIAPTPMPEPALTPTPAGNPTLEVRGPATLTRGQTASYVAMVRQPNGALEDRTDAASWTSSNLVVASLESAGRVRARQEGLVDISATYEGAAGGLNVRVTAPVLQLSGRTQLTARGETSQLTVVATLSDGTRIDITPMAQWASADASVATVNAAGVVAAVSSGLTEIEARYEGASARITVTVTLPRPRLVIDAPLTNPTSLTVTFEWRLLDAEPGRTYQFTVRLDKGTNACDSGIEEAFSAGNATRLTVTLAASRYAGQSVDFGILAEDGRGFSACEQGRRFSLP